MQGTIGICRALRGFAVLTMVGSALAIEAPGALAASTTAYHVGPVSLISTCSGQNAEVEQAVDRSNGYIYETWMGCRGIAFTRSIDGGRTFESPTYVPGSTGSNVNAWDP